MRCLLVLTLTFACVAADGIVAALNTQGSFATTANGGASWTNRRALSGATSIIWCNGTWLAAVGRDLYWSNASLLSWGRSERISGTDTNYYGLACDQQRHTCIVTSRLSGRYRVFYNEGCVRNNWRVAVNPVITSLGGNYVISANNHGAWVQMCPDTLYVSSNVSVWVTASVPGVALAGVAFVDPFARWYGFFNGGQNMMVSYDDGLNWREIPFEPPHWRFALTAFACNDAAVCVFFGSVETTTYIYGAQVTASGLEVRKTFIEAAPFYDVVWVPTNRTWFLYGASRGIFYCDNPTDEGSVWRQVPQILPFSGSFGRLLVYAAYVGSSPSATRTRSQTSSMSETPSRSETSSLTPTQTPSPTPSPSLSDSHSSTPSPSVSASSSHPPSQSPSSSVTSSPDPDHSSSSSPAPTASSSPAVDPSKSPAPSSSPSAAAPAALPAQGVSAGEAAGIAVGVAVGSTVLGVVVTVAVLRKWWLRRGYTAMPFQPQVTTQ